MSLSIDTAKITAVHALGVWHPVQQGTFFLDAYELVEEDMKRSYQLGNLYSQEYGIDQTASDWYFITPSGMTGCQWITPMGDKISMSILEIKAWRTA